MENKVERADSTGVINAMTKLVACESEIMVMVALPINSTSCLLEELGH